MTRMLEINTKKRTALERKILINISKEALNTSSNAAKFRADLKLNTS